MDHWPLPYIFLKTGGWVLSPGGVDPVLHSSCLGLALGDSNLGQHGQAEVSNAGTYGSGSGAVRDSCKVSVCYSVPDKCIFIVFSSERDYL